MTDTAAGFAPGAGPDPGSGPAGGVRLPPMTFGVPEGLHAVPLPLDAAERGAAVAELVRDIFPEGDADLWTVLQAVYGQVAEDLVAAGVAFTGIGLFDVGEGQVGHCSLTVGAMPSGQPDAEIAALGLRELWGRRPLHDVQWLDLPCGPGVSVTTSRSVVIDGAYTASGEDVTVTSGQLQVYVPFPAAPYTAVFTMDTAAVEHVEDFGALMGAILASVAFPAEEDAESPSGAVGPTA
ncbi:hypothetical protein [Streptantibioticus silvisoli]|uniref:DUF3710 domain-containing protein n=1 Tax=Streptantibioticus silvisoli TaxID=2705255 RepID=A0ABT6W1H7_9ACTN|nr:hypothetical protein [Streptantibioticus silvisoli]MDI5964255.1 hypothetical protein [Streptantibioticus silvisoli]